jgi:ceramide glucosyltransferase
LLHRNTLDRIGGLDALVHALAEDNVMGQRVRALGLSVRLADTVVAATVPESSLRALWDHEVRWMRTIRASSPLGLAASTLHYPLFWAVMAGVLSGGELWSIALFSGAWAFRLAAATGIDRELYRKVGRLAPTPPAWLLPVRDILSVVEIAASYWIDGVTWRGHKVYANWIVADPIDAQADN